MQNDVQFREVSDFLGSIKLDKYFDKMVDNGIEDLETILELQDQHIEQIGIPLGHKLKIVKRIKDLRADKGMTVPQSREGTRRADISYKDGVSSRPVTNHPYSELPGPTTTSSETNTGTGVQASTEASTKNSQGSIMVAKDHSHMPKGNMNTANSLVGISSLKEGSYSEAESHNGFLEALNAWRVAGGKNDDNGATASAKSSKKVKFTDV